MGFTVHGGVAVNTKLENLLLPVLREEFLGLLVSRQDQLQEAQDYENDFDILSEEDCG